MSLKSKIFGIKGSGPEQFGREMGGLCCQGHDLDGMVRALLKEAVIQQALSANRSAREKLWLDCAIARLFIMRMYVGELHSLQRLGIEYERNFKTILDSMYQQFWESVKRHKGEHHLRDIIKSNAERRLVYTLASLSGDRDYISPDVEPNPKMALYPIAEAVVENRMADYRKRYEEVIPFDWQDPDKRRGPWIGIASELYRHLTGNSDEESSTPATLAINLYLRAFGMACLKLFSGR